MSSLGLKVVGFLASATSLGASLYLTYRILKHVMATEGMWAIYWINIPLLAISMIISAMLRRKE